jgi:hypothetical protein
LTERARALAAAVVLLAACGTIAERRLAGQWRTEATPERTLDLFDDGTYALRLSGKGLGFVSELLGPRKGSWRVENGALVLSHKEADSEVERSERWPINELHSDRVVLAGERWRRVSEAEPSR